jgi:hypothetical protein
VEELTGIVFGLLMLVEAVGWLWLVVLAFKVDFGSGCTMLALPLVFMVVSMVFASPLFGALLVLSVPVLGMRHVQQNEGDGKLPFLLTLPGTLAIVVLVILGMAGVVGETAG